MKCKIDLILSIKIFVERKLDIFCYKLSGCDQNGCFKLLFAKKLNVIPNRLYVFTKLMDRSQTNTRVHLCRWLITCLLDTLEDKHTQTRHEPYESTITVIHQAWMNHHRQYLIALGTLDCFMPFALCKIPMWDAFCISLSLSLSL